MNHQNPDTLAARIIQAYSFRANLRTLFIRHNDRWAFLDGYRAIGIFWVILGHCFISLQNHFGMEGWGSLISEMPIYFQWIFNGDVAVDGFLMVSGFLMSNILMKHFQETGQLGVKIFYLSRFLRLTPAYFFAIGIYYLFQNTENKIIWPNFFYLQNFVTDYSAYFLPFSWSLAVEEQFYLLLPLYLAFILLKTRNPFNHLLLLFIISFIIRSVIILNDDILREQSIKGIIFNQAHFGHYFVVIYDNLYSRFGAFIGGIAAAYAYRYRQEQSLRLLNSRSARYITVLAMISALTLCLMPVLMKGFELPQSINVSLNIFRSNIVCACAAWLLFCGIFSVNNPNQAAHHNAQRFNKAMSIKIFHPFGHLLYSMYLFHYIAVTFVLGNMNLNFRLFNIDYMAHFGWWMLLAVVLSMIGTTLIAIFSYLFIEAPIMNLRPKFKA